MMRVEFIRSGDRRYGVRIHRDGEPTLIMDPAPGFDANVPHDMVHMIVEAVLGLQHGVFGQLAAGGTAGSFRVESTSGKIDARAQARERKRVASKGKALLDAGKESDLSEAAAAIFDTLWRSRKAGKSPPPEVAGEMARMRSALSRAEETAFVTAEPRIMAQFDRLAAVWRELSPGHSIALTWPTLALED